MYIYINKSIHKQDYILDSELIFWGNLDPGTLPMNNVGSIFFAWSETVVLLRTMYMHVQQRATCNKWVVIISITIRNSSQDVSQAAKSEVGLAGP